MVLFDLSALFVLLVPEAHVVPFVDVGHVVLLVRVEFVALLVRVESVVPWVCEESFLYVQVCGDAEGAQAVRPEFLLEVLLFPHRLSHLLLLRRCALLLWKVLVFYLFLGWHQVAFCPLSCCHWRRALHQEGHRYRSHWFLVSFFSPASAW